MYLWKVRGTLFIYKNIPRVSYYLVIFRTIIKLAHVYTYISNTKMGTFIVKRLFRIRKYFLSSYSIVNALNILFTRKYVP